MKQSGNIRAFRIYLAGQGISNFGDSVRFIAVTMLIFNFTGSGISTALGVVFSTLPSIIASPFAGVLGDRIDERRILIMVDFIRFLTIPLYIFVNSVYQIFLLLILISIFDVFYNPSRKKFVLELTGKSGALNANSLLTGISGAAYLVGPLAAGVLTDRYGSAPAILIAGSCCLLSCFLTLAAGFVSGWKRTVKHDMVKSLAFYNVTNELRKGISYSFISPAIRSLLAIGTVIGFCTISVNLAFYPYAFDALKVTAKGWSLMITVYYGTNLIAMLLVKYLERLIRGRESRFFYGGLLLCSVIWAFYAVINKFEEVLVLQFIEGSVIALCGIILAARFQTITEKRYMARVSGINDIFSNLGKLTGMFISMILIGNFTYGAVFVYDGAMLLLFSITGLAISKW